MAFWSRSREPYNRTSSDELADFGRYEFLGEQSGLEPLLAYNAFTGLNELVFSGQPANRALVVEELSRHAAVGEWEKVGAWKYVREFLDDAPDTRPLIDGGLLALERMAVSNLSIHLSERDAERYREATGGPVPHDGFWGPPVFASDYGPGREHYLNEALASAARREVARLLHGPGVEPAVVENPAQGLWDFGMLLHRGPLVMPEDLRSEQEILAPAVALASGVDHQRFLDLLSESIHDPDGYQLGGPWAALGAARFAEDYLVPETLASVGYRRLLDTGIGLLLEMGVLGLMVPPEILTPIQQDRVAQLAAAPQ